MIKDNKEYMCMIEDNLVYKKTYVETSYLETLKKHSNLETIEYSIMQAYKWILGMGQIYMTDNIMPDIWYPARSKISSGTSIIKI